MNNWYFFGIFCFLQVFISFEKDIKGSPGEIKFLCAIFPEILKETCDEYNYNVFENKIEIKVRSEMEFSTTSKSIQCDICKRFIEKVLNDIGKDRTENTIRKALEKACDKVPPNLRQPCKFILLRFENLLVDMIIKNIPVDQICHNIELCSSNDINHSQKVKSIQCLICKRIVEEIFRRIGNKRTEDEIRKAMQGICDIFPVPVQNDCRNLMNAIADSIVKLIKNNVGPEMICSILQMCFKDTIQTDDGSGYDWKITGETDEFGGGKITGESVKSIQCQLCKRIVEEIFRRIGNKRTEDAIRKAMQGICNIFPVPVRNDCRNLMNAVASSIVKLIKNNVVPKMICSILQVCFKDTIKTNNEVKSIQCQLCKKIVEEIFRRIVNKQTEDEIRKAMQCICNIFPVPVQNDCRNLMNSIADSIVKLIKTNVGSDIICRFLQMCFNGKIQTDGDFTPKDTLYFPSKFNQI